MERVTKEKKVHLEWAKAYWPQDYEVVDEMKILKEENKKLKEKVRFLEECLDRKEKVNKRLREELDKRKSTFVYDAKKVRDVL